MSNSQHLINLPSGETLKLCDPGKVKLLRPDLPDLTAGKALLPALKTPAPLVSPPLATLSKTKAAGLLPKTAPGLFTGAGPKAGALAKGAKGLSQGAASIGKGAAGISKTAAIPGIASAGALPMGSLGKLFLGTGGASISLGSSAFVLTPLLTLAGVGLGAFVIYRRSRAMTLKAESDKLKRKAKILDQQSEKLWPIGF